MRSPCVRPKRSISANWRGSGPQQRLLSRGLSLTSSSVTNAGRFASDDETLSSISPHYGAFQHLLELMEAREIDRSVVDGYDAIFQRAIAAGQLHEDFAALSQFLGKPHKICGKRRCGRVVVQSDADN